MTSNKKARELIPPDWIIRKGSSYLIITEPTNGGRRLEFTIRGAWWFRPDCKGPVANNNTQDKPDPLKTLEEVLMRFFPDLEIVQPELPNIW